MKGRGDKTGGSEGPPLPPVRDPGPSDPRSRVDEWRADISFTVHGSTLNDLITEARRGLRDVLELPNFNDVPPFHMTVSPAGRLAGSGKVIDWSAEVHASTRPHDPLRAPRD